MEYLITLALGFVAFIVYWLASGVNYWKKRDIPYVRSLPFFGNALNLVLRRKTFAQNLCDIYKKLEGEKFGGYMQFTSPVLVICDPDLVNQILIKDFDNFFDRSRQLDDKVEPLSGSLISLTGFRWQIVRQKLSPSFTSGRLKMMFDEIVQWTDDAIEYLKNKKGDVDIKIFMLKFNLKVLAAAIFGLKPSKFCDKSGKDNCKEVEEYTVRFFSPSLENILTFILQMCFPGLVKLLRLRKLDNDTFKLFEDLVQDEINQRKDANKKTDDLLQIMYDLHKHEISKISQKNIKTKKNGTLEAEKNGINAYRNMDRLHKTVGDYEHQCQVFTESCITAQTFLFVSGGSETIGTALSFSVYELAANPHVQSKLQNEIDTVLASNEFNYDTIKSMVYLDNVVNEILRMHPPIGVVRRICASDYRIPGTDKVIEKGVIINIPVLALHMDPKYFSDPETFNPDRFNDMGKIPKGVLIPFSVGPRMCIVNRMAIMQMKIFIVKMLSNFDVILGKRTRVPLKMSTNSFMQNSANNIWVSFKERKHQ